MHGETNLAMLLRSMQPQLHPQPYVFCSVDEPTFAHLALVPQGLFREAEGITLIVEQQQAASAGLPFEHSWACITLSVHSSLSAVGFLAAITTTLANAGLSVNPVAAYYHDHLFVPWEAREQALQLLHEFAR